MLNLDIKYCIEILLKHIHVENLFQDQNKYMLLMNDHEIELFYNNDLLMSLRVIGMYYLFEVDLLEEMVEMVGVLIQQSKI